MTDAPRFSLPTTPEATDSLISAVFAGASPSILAALVQAGVVNHETAWRPIQLPNIFNHQPIVLPAMVHWTARMLGSRGSTDFNTRNFMAGAGLSPLEAPHLEQLPDLPKVLAWALHDRRAWSIPSTMPLGDVADWYQASTEEKSSLLGCCARAGWAWAVHAMLSVPGRPDVSVEFGEALASHALSRDNEGVLEVLVQHGLVAPTPQAGNPWLHRARSARAVDVLMAMGADPAARDAEGKTCVEAWAHERSHMRSTPGDMLDIYQQCLQARGGAAALGVDLEASEREVLLADFLKTDDSLETAEAWVSNRPAGFLLGKDNQTPGGVLWTKRDDPGRLARWARVLLKRDGGPVRPADAYGVFERDYLWALLAADSSKPSKKVLKQHDPEADSPAVCVDRLERLMVWAGKAAPIPTTNTGGTGSAARSRREMVGELALRLLAVGAPGARGDKENTFGGFLAWSAQPSETLRLLAIVATSGILLADTGPSATSRPYIWNTDIRLAIKQADLIASEGDDGQRELLAAIMGQMLTQTSQSVIARLASAFSHDQVKASLMSWQSQGGLAKTMAQPAPEKEHFDLMQPDSRLVHLIATMGRWARADESKAFQVALPQDGALWNSDGAPKPEQAVFLAMMRELAMQQTLGSAPRANRPRM